MRNFFQKFKEGFSKTSQNLWTSSRGLLSGRKLDATSIEQLEEALYAADFGVETATEIVDEVQEAVKRERDLRGQDAAVIGATILKRVLAGSEGVVKAAADSPTVICLVGVNGSGKTTTCAKLAHALRGEGKQVLMAACDTFRAAANEQIKAWSQRLDIELVSSHHGADSAAVAFDAWQAARKRNKDYLILDTAGRLHTKSNLMEELTKIKRVLQKQDPATPHYSLLVVDGSLGSNSIEQAKVFHKLFGLDGLIVTKLDGTSRGGALVGIYRELKLPIFFLGLGEQPEDLQPYSVDNYVNAVFGMEQVAGEAQA
jgi:fused signal recognition particle receptor